jgi:Holliday junction resolvase
MNGKAKGSRAERRCMALLEANGFVCTRAGASLGLFDVIAIGARGVRCIQVKAGTRRLSALEREAIEQLRVPPSCTKEYWRFPDRCRDPLIEVLS